MARIFTTTFEFNHQAYDAVVIVATHSNQITFTIKVPDSELHHFIPNGEISFKGPKGFEQIDGMNDTVSQSLLRKISDAIEDHMVNS